MTNVNNNQDRYESSFGKVVEDAVGLNNFQDFIHPLTFPAAAKLFGKSVVYLKKIASGERPFNDFGKSRQDVLNFLKTSAHAAKSRQQYRNAVGYKEYIGLIGLDKYKCACCLYPASETIYRLPLCEHCVSKAKSRVVVNKIRSSKWKKRK